MSKKIKSTMAQKRWSFLLALALFAIPCMRRFFTGKMNAQNTTVFAFSYDYGFISRGLMGTIWQGLNDILPVDLINYEAIQTLSKWATFVFVIALLAFYNVCMKKCNEKNMRQMQYLCCFLSVFSFPNFVSNANFGRLDVYLMIFTIIGCILLVKEKWEWLLIPICTFCTVMHHGYVFLYLNIILVLLFYKIIMNDKKRKKYIVILCLTFLLPAVLFIYFEFFSHPTGENIYEEIVTLSKALARDGKSYSESMVNHEILGMDVFELEWPIHIMNYKETPFFLMLFMVYVVIGIGFLVRLVRGKNGKEKWAYIAVALGSVTVLPQIILKVDYGRYAYAIFFYYIAIVMCLMAMKDAHVIQQLEDSMKWAKDKIPAAKLLIVYPLIFMPFLDVSITDLTYEIYTLLGI